MTRRSLVVRGGGFRVRQKALLRDIELRVEPGEIVALVGPNGAGKSTLLRLLAGDLPPTEGEILLDDRPIGSYRARELAARRAVLPQQTILQFAFTSREVVEMGRGLAAIDDEAAIDLALARTDSTYLAGQIYPTLSGGEQGRVTLSRVLAQEAPLLLLDEPTASLDLRHQQMVMDVMRALVDEGAMVVAVLHDLNLASSSADRVVVMSEGRIAADGTPWETLREDLLAEVFECQIAVSTHPLSGRPLVLPLASTRKLSEPEVLPASGGRRDASAALSGVDT
jgi:iron complex transport system ATP-binding protein